MAADQDERRGLRVKLAVAAVTGILAGAARAVVDWLLRNMISIG